MSLTDRFQVAMDAAAQSLALCVGDVMLDRYVEGEVARISPEGPVPVFRERATLERLGGAANVFMNLAALGLRPHLVGAVGDDPEGRSLEALASAAGGCTLIRVARAPTTIKTRYIARGQQMMRVDREETAPLSESEARALEDIVAERIGEAGLLILSDYAKGALAGDTAVRLIGLARARGVPVIVDPKSRDFGRYRGADLVTPNLSELRAAAGAELSDAGDIAEAARALSNAHEIGRIAVTLSENGVLIAGGDGPDFAAPVHKSEVYDVAGAGDVVVAVLSAAIMGGMTTKDAAEVAMVAAGISVTRVGAVSVSRDEIAGALGGWANRLHSRIFTDHQTLRAQVEAWRSDGLTIGFANGVFDLLHVGHVSLLQQAAQACDRLIAALNSDDSVKRLKGPERPIQSADVRSIVLAGLEGVAAVTTFSEDTPEALIRLVEPDVLVKGGDYTRDQVVGADVVEARGGRVLLVDLVSGQSTTGTVSRIRGKG